MSHSTTRAAVGHALFLLAVAQGAHAAPFAYITEGLGESVSVVDTANNRMIARIPVGRAPSGVAVNPAGTRVYVTNSRDDTVSIIDTATNRVIGVNDVGRHPHRVAVSRSGTRVYVANYVDGTVSILDARTLEVVGSIPVGGNPTWLAMSADGMRLYVTNLARSIAVIDVPAERLAATIPLAEPAGSVAVDPQGKRLYVVIPRDSYATGSVVVIDASTHATLGAVAVGQGPVGIALNPAGTRAYVANTGNEDIPGDEVSVIDTESLAVATVRVVGKHPVGISVNPSGTHVYVTVANSNLVSVIDAATNQHVASIAVGREPLALGDFIARVNVALAADNFQGVWWNSPPGSESGWGVNISHQGDILFATWFTYDADGSPLWLVMSNGARAGEKTYSGTLHRTTGPSFSAVPSSPAAVTSIPVGSATFAFTGDNGTFSYTVNGITQTKTITRYAFGPLATTCTTGGAAGAPNYQDLWWRSPAGSEPGWGVNIAHQGDLLFATWFTYDANGRGLWLSMSSKRRTGSNTYAGQLYRTTGPAFSAIPWSPAQVITTAVGSAVLTFDDSNNGTFAYSLEGVSRSEPITRYVYALPATVCR